jgi:hypothetical protein
MKMILKIFLLFFFFAILENNVDALSCNQVKISKIINLIFLQTGPNSLCIQFVFASCDTMPNGRLLMHFGHRFVSKNDHYVVPKYQLYNARLV